MHKAYHPFQSVLFIILKAIYIGLPRCGELLGFLLGLPPESHVGGRQQREVYNCGKRWANSITTTASRQLSWPEGQQELIASSKCVHETTNAVWPGTNVLSTCPQLLTLVQYSWPRCIPEVGMEVVHNHCLHQNFVYSSVVSMMSFPWLRK